MPNRRGGDTRALPYDTAGRLQTVTDSSATAYTAVYNYVC